MIQTACSAALDLKILENASKAEARDLVPHRGIARLRLTNFRSHANLSMDIDLRPVVITGPNGAGKTNILEALSYLAPGRGLRGAKLFEVMRQETLGESPTAGSESWGVWAKLQSSYGMTHLGTGCEAGGGQSEKRVVKIDQDQVSQNALSDHISLLWLTPQMDRIFIDGVTARRKFLDRLVYSFDAGHATRVMRYEHAMRERLKLLKTSGLRYGDWLGALEAKMAESATAIAAARLHTIEALSEAGDWSLGLFPQAHVFMKGLLEEDLQKKSALFAEDHYKELLFTSRGQDLESGRTTHGPHRSEMIVVYKAKNQLAELCSTGEQKALLLSIIMTASRLQSVQGERVPLLLLDEVVAHLDERRREAVLEEICALQIQAWMTGTEALAFTSLKERAQHFKIVEGVLEAL